MLRGFNDWIRHWLRGDAPPDPDEPVVVLEASTEMEAEIARSKLDAFEIPAYVRNTTTIASYGATPWGTWQVFVRHGDYLRARTVMEDTAHPASAEEDR